jgi:site-specific DNA-cytosine methylase
MSNKIINVQHDSESLPIGNNVLAAGGFRVLVACEYSGRVRDAFSKLGFNAWSCDLLATETPGNHYQCDISEVINLGWDLMICHPPCTDLAVSGARHFKEKILDGRQQKALEFVEFLLNCPIKFIALENPISVISSKIRKPNQIIQPWQFGHGETKSTCLWLKGLPKLKPTNIVEGREAKIHKMPPSPDRWKNRSRTYQGIADAMAVQWGDAVLSACS